MSELIIGIIVIGLIIAAQAVRITREYERGVVFRLGRLIGVKGPGLFFLIPIVDKMERIQLRIITLDVPEQDVITQDNVPVKVDAVLYFRVSDPTKAVIEVENFLQATSQIAQTSLRSVVGKSSLDEILGKREKVNEELHRIIDDATDPWGIKVSAVEVKHVEIPQDMQRVIARQAEAERMRRSKIIMAEGEFQAAQKLQDAARVLGAEPIILRYLETITDAAKERNTTVLFPMEMMNLAKNLLAKK